MALGNAILTVNASWVALIHTVFAASAFGGALLVGTYLHYHKIVKNEWYGYPQEWFPSVSATVGDYYPERQIFQILIAFTSGPRLLLVFLTYVLQTHFSTKSQTSAAKFVSICGLLRTICCGGWVYVTSSDDHDWHDVMMISYLVLTIPWQLGNVILSPDTAMLSGNTYRKRFSGLFFFSIIPLVYLYIQHKVNRVPGAYTYYAFIEWSLILYDVLYDSCTIMDFAHFDFILLATPKDEVDVAKGLTGIKSRLSKGGLHTNSGGYTRKISPALSALKPMISSPQLNEIMQFSTHIYLGFVFWTTLTAIGPVIFYFSVWSMGLDGQEVLLFVTAAPLLLCLPLIRTLLFKMLPLLRLMSLLSIGSYLVDRDLFYEDSVLRLQLTAISLGLCTTLQVIQLSKSKNQFEMDKHVMALGIGLVFSVLIKYANYSLNPMWPIMRMNNGGYNRLGLFLGILANLYLEYNRRSEVKAGKWDAQDPLRPKSSDQLGPTWWKSVCGFGGMMFLIHTLFTDSGTMIAWVWDGYPITGPLPTQHGYLMITAMCIGLFLPCAQKHHMLQDPRWLLIGYVSAFGLHNYHGWLGFASGCLLCIFTLSIFPRYLKAVVISSKPDGWWKLGLGFGLGYIIYDLMELFHTFTVAYAFVPGGNIFRERTDVVLAVTMLLIGVGFFQSNSSEPVIEGYQETKKQRFKTTMNVFLAISIASSLLVMMNRTMSKAEVKPYHSENQTFKAGIWTVHFGVDSGMWESQRRIRDIIQEMELDVVGLLETDLHRIVMGNRDLTQFISEDLGMYVDMGPGPNKHTWGAALLSKFPIVKSTHHLLPSPRGELAPAIHATLNMWGTFVDVIVSHNGQEEDPLDRQLQSTELARIMREAYPRPFVFLGYVVTSPHAPRPAPYQILVEDGKMLDIERSDYDRWCEYILFRGLRRVGYARVTRGSNPAVTDTELQVGMFQVPPNWVNVHPDRDLSDYYRVPPQAIQPSIWFSPKVGSSDGFKGHRYHVLREQFGTDVIYYRLY